LIAGGKRSLPGAAPTVARASITNFLMPLALSDLVPQVGQRKCLASNPGF
jgi:hypothetical protein